MRFRRIAAVYLICIALPAASGNTVQEIKQFVESAIERHNPDKEVAEVLRTMKLSERLDPDTVEALQKQGAGPKTVSALKALVAETENLPPASAPAAKPAGVPLAPPSPKSRPSCSRMCATTQPTTPAGCPISSACEQTRRYVNTTGHDSWRPTDVISARLSYFNQHEDYKLISQNDRVITEGDYRSVGGATSTGDFGTTMERIFDPKSHARIEWKRWATLRRQRMHVFSYRVALGFSDFSIHAGHGERDEKDPAMTVLVGYHGEIFVDRQLGAITRITKEADDIPKSFPIRQASETLDYDYTKIGESEFLLPLSVDVRMQTAREWMKNVKEFRLYRNSFTFFSLVPGQFGRVYLTAAGFPILV